MTNAIPPQPLDIEERERTAREWLLPWIDQHRPLDGAVVIDFGCGPGAYTKPLAERADRVIAVDIDEQEVAVARSRLAGTRNVALTAGSFEQLVAFVGTHAHDGADVFLLAATLEHMTISERLAVLRLALDTLRDDGVLVIWETPNRLLWSDHHTTQDPFFHQLPEELAMTWVDRVPRTEVAQAVRAGGELQLWRWGRGASYHELELGFGALEHRVLAGGYDPDTIDLRGVDRDELALAAYMGRELPHLHPCFSRYWLDLIVRRTPSSRPVVVWRPWPFATNYGYRVTVSRWGLVHFTHDDSWLGVRLDTPVRGLLLGLEPAQRTGLGVWQGPWENMRWIAQVDLGPSEGTVYRMLPLVEPVDELILRVDAPLALSFLATQSA
jgi:SAM-dependent methyltransferase